MHKLIEWFTKNPVAANLMMMVIIFYGIYAVKFKIPLEVFPTFEQEVINISASYPGATPYEAEQGIGLRIEEALADLEGIDHIFTNASEGSVQVRVEVNNNYDFDPFMNEVKSRIDRITGFPDGTEKPTVERQVRKRELISVVLSGAVSERELYETAKQVRDEIAVIPGTSQPEITGLRPYEIAIEISPETLEQYNLSLQTVSDAIRNHSRDIPAGKLKTDQGEIRIRTLGQAYVQEDFENITIISRDDGTHIKLRDIANVNDGFTEDPLYAVFDNQRSAVIEVYRIGNASAIEVAEKVKAYIIERQQSLPEGVTLSYWKDRSRIVEARLNTLFKSAWQGMLLIFLLLAIFLRPSVALWVSVGIPISFFGALGVLPELGVTLNIVSLFAFIIVLGIVVDDAIVTGENVYRHLKKNPNSVEAAIKGTQEVSIPVTFGVLTTMAAFLPLMMIEGRRGDIFAQIPMIVIPVLFFSLIESKFILPAHMRHIHPKKDDRKENIFIRLQQKIANALEWFIENIYQPFLEKALNFRYLTVSVFIVLLTISSALVMSGHYKFTFFPRVQSERVRVNLVMQEGTPIEITTKYVQHIKEQAEKLQQKYVDPITQESIVEHILITVGSTGGSLRSTSGGTSNKARISFEVTPLEQRTLPITSSQLVKEWRKMIGPIPGLQEMSFRAEIGRGGDPIDVQLSGHDYGSLSAVAELVTARLATFEGVFDIKNSYEDAKDEFQIKLKPEAEFLGLTLSQIGQQVRGAFYGVEAQRILRNQDEIKVMVRFPADYRHSIADLENLKIRTPSGREVLLPDVANIIAGKGATKISRVDRKRTINVTADISKEEADVVAINKELTPWLKEILKEYPGVYFELEGEQKEQEESFSSLKYGLYFVLFIIYGLLAIPFRSYVQPFIVMIIIPFSIIGALLGHSIMGMGLSVSSLMGLLALTGVVVNDSLVLVDYINRRVREGIPLKEAVRISGGARFRPILLTSLTTFAGLLPLIFEKSTQAQFLIPMAVSLGFGILFATFITLLLIPATYLILEDIKTFFRNVFRLIFKKASIH
jgi:multidrug efflux pump subunit AcrB